jgi:polyhydroxybutyrate depolymerase
VFSFHGRGDDADNFQHVDLHVAWPEAIVVYFQGLEPPGGLAGWQVERGENRDRDLKLVDAALASLRAKYAIDDDRVYAMGFSNGAMFTYLLWAERPGLFGAYAANAGRLRASVRPTVPRPFFHIAGERDQQVAFSDQKAAIAVAIGVNGVGNRRAACGEGCTLYGSDAPAPVMTWIHRGGHEYPRGTSERIAAFFRTHARTR